MSLYSIQEETLTNIADAIREQTGTEEEIATTEMPNMIRSIVGGSSEAVLYVEQILTEEQKEQARANIDAPSVDFVPTEKSDLGIYVNTEEPVGAVDGDLWLDLDEDQIYTSADTILAEDKAEDGNVEIFTEVSIKTDISTQIETLESQNAYLAIMTENTDILEVSTMFEKIKKWYKQGLWTEKMVNDAVSKNIISMVQAEEIFAQ